MIAVQYQQGRIVIEGGTTEGRDTLTRPLHKIFFRSVLRGKPDNSDNRWLVPVETDAIKPLQGILDHFAKYGIECSIDDKCRSIIQEAEKKRNIFREVLKKGLAAKKWVATPPNQQLLQTLGAGLARQLTKLQLLAVNHLMVVRNGANFSVSGSGKTTIALAYYHQLRKQNLVDALLVIGPGSCFEPWEQEYLACFGEHPKSIRLAGNTRTRRMELLAVARQYDLLLTTYHSATRDLRELVRMLSRRKFLVILDESHYVKRPQGGKLAEAVLSLSPYAAYRLVLTGTPMPNGLADLWSQFTFLWPEELPLGTADDYLRLTKQNDSSNSIRNVRDRISSLFFRITKSQLELPRPHFRILKCEMSPLQRRIYLGVASKFLSQIAEHPNDRDSLREWRRARAVRLLQIAVNPTLLRKRCEEFRLPALDLSGIPLRDAIEHYADYEIPNKVALACGLARKLCVEGNKVILWSTFVHNLEMLEVQLHDLNPVVVYGEVPALATDLDDFSRETLIAQFREDPRCQVLIANPAACAESISLHMTCHHAIYVDRSFNCAHYLQSLDRIHRLGLPKSVSTFYHLLISSGSIDDIVHERLKDKSRKMRDVIEGELPGVLPGYWSEDLGDEEIADLALVEDHIKSLFASRARKAK